MDHRQLIKLSLSNSQQFLKELSINQVQKVNLKSQNRFFSKQK